MNNSNLILNEKHNSLHLFKKLKKNVSLKKVIELSNKLNLPYSKLINLYINKGINYSYSYIVNLIENEDVQKLKEIILNNGLIIYQRNVYIHSRSNELQGVFLDDKYYQKLLIGYNCEILAGNTVLSCNYPGDIAYNIIVAENFAIHNFSARHISYN